MTADQLAKLPLKDLRALAAGRGIAGSAKLRKDELVSALATAMAGERREPPAPAAGQAGSSTPPQAQAWQPAPSEHGLPVPDRYGRDRLVLLVQDPSHVFAYWEVAPETLARVRAEAGSHAAAVLVLHGPGGAEQREVDLNGGNYYLAVAPGSLYEAELCLRASDGRLIRIAMSNRIHTPAAGPSWRTDEAWMEVDESFQDLLALAGVPGSLGSSMGSGSGQRFRNVRQIRVRPLSEEAEVAGGAITAPAAAATGNPGSLGVMRSTVETWSSASLSSAVLARSVALGSGSGSGLGLGVGLSSGQLLSSGVLSSRALSSRSLSSRSVGSGTVIEGAAEAQYPVDGVFHAPPTGLPKAVEGVPSTPAPAAAAPTQPNPGQPAPAAPPVAPNAAAPAPASDPLAFIGAPKPASQRKPKPARA
jgi:hypothetical protein